MRLSTVLCIAAAGAVIINFILILKDVRLDFLKPIFRQPFMRYVQGTMTVSAVSMGELLVFTMVVPLLGKGQKAREVFLARAGLVGRVRGGRHAA